MDATDTLIVFVIPTNGFFKFFLWITYTSELIAATKGNNKRNVNYLDINK